MLRTTPSKKYIYPDKCMPLDVDKTTKLLHHIVFAESINVEKVIDMLNTDKLKTEGELLYDGGTCIAPSGSEILRYSPYDCALAAGDYELADIISKYFDEGALKCQHNAFKLKFEKMLEQAPYDLNSLCLAIIISNEADVQAELNQTKDYSSPLHDAMIDFRSKFAHEVIHDGEMHFHYQDFQHALNMYAQYFANEKSISTDKKDLFLRQVIGYEQRFFPARDRQEFIHNLFDVANNQVIAERSFKSDHTGITFPITANTHSNRPFHAINAHGLGYKFAIGPDGQQLTSMSKVQSWQWHDFVEAYAKYIDHKQLKLKEHMGNENTVSLSEENKLKPSNISNTSIILTMGSPIISSKSLKQEQTVEDEPSCSSCFCM